MLEQGIRESGIIVKRFDSSNLNEVDQIILKPDHVLELTFSFHDLIPGVIATWLAGRIRDLQEYIKDRGGLELIYWRYYEEEKTMIMQFAAKHQAVNKDGLVLVKGDAEEAAFMIPAAVWTVGKVIAALAFIWGVGFAFKYGYLFLTIPRDLAKEWNLTDFQKELIKWSGLTILIAFSYDYAKDKVR